MINDRFIKHLKLLNYLLPILEIMKERKYDLYGGVKCKLCHEENENDDHSKQLNDKWIIIANNTMCKCNQELLITRKIYSIKSGRYTTITHIEQKLLCPYY
ncbi:hypothetical protein RhiirC2_777167 [Rhizophagus irregularis]|uniref:Uncharacterized protein n=1 Tax=Rhizophagus irregularis TaxID=588596 RepID=A0A2N1NF05_9GLOM|nr:hypothetical protein RhiirC2_777167 [Rhizophagus irregularis]